MRDSLDILKSYHKGRAQGFRFALATIIATEGSTYQKSGAKLLIRNDGERIGLVSGGCLENDIVEAALLAMGREEPTFLTFDHSDEADKTLGTGLGCRGKIIVWVEPIPEKIDTKTFSWWIGRSPERYSYRAWTILASSHPDWVGARCFMMPGFSKTTAGSIPWRELESAIPRQPTNQAQRHHLATESGWCDVLVEPFVPPLRLVLWGLGIDTAPLYRFAVEMGWEIYAYDHRPINVKPELFSDADLIQLARAEVLDDLPFDDRTAVMIMTHHYPTDLSLLKTLATKSVPYIGLLGPIERRNQLLQDMATDGVKPSSQFQAHLYGPAGIKLGGRSPTEVALSIIAEIQAVFHAKEAPHLRGHRE